MRRGLPPGAPVFPPLAVTGLISNPLLFHAAWPDNPMTVEICAGRRTPGTGASGSFGSPLVAGPRNAVLREAQLWFRGRGLPP
jgi:hypothetical protein